MTIRIEKFAVTTDGSGDWSETREIKAGALLQMRYIVDGSSPLATGWDLTIAGALTGFVYFNATNLGTSSFQASPRVPTVDSLNAASLYAGAGEPVEDLSYVGDEDLIVTVAQGGDTKVGTIYVWTQD